MPRKKKTIVEKFEPEGQQFDAVVQGVYESQVKKHLGKKSTAPFKDRNGVRLDEKFMLDQETIKKLLASAFSIATAQGQKLGTLKKGTQTATAKGRAKSAARMKDKKLSENIADYEYTLSLARKSSPYRIVEHGRGRSKRFVVEPLGKPYKTEAAAKACITRERKKGGIEDLPTMDNPFGWFKKDKPMYQLFEIDRGFHSDEASFERRLYAISNPSPDPHELARMGQQYASRAEMVVATATKPRKYFDSEKNKAVSFKELVKELKRPVANPSDKDITKSFYGLIGDAKKKMKPMGSNSEYGTWVSRQAYAKSRGLKDGSRVRFKSGSKDAPEPITAYPVLKTLYHDWMTDDQGIPFPMYRRAPIARYWTIELYGPKWRFERYVENEGKIKLFDERFWESADWAGHRGYKLQERTYQPFQRKGTDEIDWAPRQTKNDIVALKYRTGRDPTAAAGFNMSALGLARNAVREAYAEWYPRLQPKLQSKNPELTYPQDALKPLYPKLPCQVGDRQIEYFVLDPKVHLGVLVRAIVCVIQMQGYKGNSTKGGVNYINTSEIKHFLNQHGITRDVKRAIWNSKVFGDVKEMPWLQDGMDFASVVTKK